MAKWYGKIGFCVTEETEPGVWENKVTEKNYYGDLLSNFRKLQNSGDVNDNIDIANKISIISDPFVDQNFHLIHYVEFMGTKWKVTHVEVLYPRLILTLGGVYNGNSSGTSN
jgi:hypothetical protein